MGVQDPSVKHTDHDRSLPPGKRARTQPAHTTRAGGKRAIDLTTSPDNENQDQDILLTSPKKKAATKKRAKDEEKRLRQFRVKAPKSYLDKLERATSQRMFVISRTRTPSSPSSSSTEKEGQNGPREVLDLAGSTGNIYTITVCRQPTCTYPDNKKGNQCKHIVYVMHNVLKAPADLEYQLAFLTSELEDIFSRAPLPTASGLNNGKGEGKEGDADTQEEEGEEALDATGRKFKRKSLEENECPICFMPFEPSDAKEDIVWCRAACGNNVHKSCFEQWALAQRGKEVQCVFCRSVWKGDEDSVSKIQKAREKGVVNGEGYVNVADELGLSRFRGKWICSFPLRDIHNVRFWTC